MMFSNKPLEKAISDRISANDIVIVAPLNWGLGHAARCIPIIYKLLSACKEVIIASDGDALTILQREFPHLQSFDLPAYNIRYKYEHIVINMMTQLPNIWKAVREEEKVAQLISSQTGATVILSDNRLGFRCNGLKNIYLTHQINILHQNKIVSSVASQCHKYFINKFDLYWVPDFNDNRSLAPEMSNNTSLGFPVYIGPITRIHKEDIPTKNDILVILSGPEPQRSYLEEQLWVELGTLTHLRILFIRGTNDMGPSNMNYPHIESKNIVDSHYIQTALNSSKILISRSGYSTIMDIHTLDIKAIFIPTPGQTEQEYLAQIHGQSPKYISITQKEVPNILDAINTLLQTN